MGITSIIEVVLGLLGGVLNQTKLANGLPAQIVADVEAAIAALQRVQGTPVTMVQLESLRVNPAWTTTPQNVTIGSAPPTAPPAA
jgi:hypothetical protein